MYGPAAVSELHPEVARRRTFAIISHPDAGKTTMTEKLLLFGGAIQLAGTVRARKATRHATSDWMKLEQERGISVTTSVMQFPYDDHVINLLDTPGHQDFSEDTYRTLTAVDSALMVIDAAKGVETQTVKLFRICRQRDVPVMTFINKLDRDGQPPLDLIAEVEEVLGMTCVPFSWPIGMGKEFRGVYNLHRDRLELFNAGGERRPQDIVRVDGIDDPQLDRVLGSGDVVANLREEVELVREAGDTFDRERYLAARQTPTFFGSALNNFGVSEFLDALVELAPPPRPTPSTVRPITPDEENFSGFVFKIQANMNPQHRDRIAFLRVCSGRFEQGMKLHQVRTGTETRIRNAITFLARERTIVEEAWPGDILGLHDKGSIQVGDTFTEGEELQVTGIPHFAPELFRRVRLDNPLASKALHKGLGHLGEEGAAQVFKMELGGDLVVGAVGQLQFDVVAHRLNNEYGVDASFALIDFKVARWIQGTEDDVSDLAKLHPHRFARDARNRPVVLAATRFQMEAMQERYPRLTFRETMEITAS